MNSTMAVFANVVACFVLCFATDLRAQLPVDVSKKLDDAKQAYDSQMESYREEVMKWFEKEDQKARSSKNGVGDRVAEIAAESAEFQRAGNLPNRVPLLLRDRQAKAANALFRTYQTVADSLYRDKRDTDAMGVLAKMKELETLFAKSKLPSPDRCNLFECDSEGVYWLRGKGKDWVCVTAGGEPSLWTESERNDEYIEIKYVNGIGSHDMRVRIYGNDSTANHNGTGWKHDRKGGWIR